MPLRMGLGLGRPVRFKVVVSRSRRNADAQRKQNYGLTPKQYDRLVKKSCGRCALCNKPADLAVDHCHRTKIVRGLLCKTCNTHLIYLESHGHDLAWMKRAIQYISRRGKLPERRRSSAPIFSDPVRPKLTALDYILSLAPGQARA